MIDYRVINPEYGTIDDMKRLVKKGDARDIIILVDYVVNHTSSQHPWFKSARLNISSPKRDHYLCAQESEVYRWQSQPYNLGLPWQWHIVDSTDASKGRYYDLFWREMSDRNIEHHDVVRQSLTIVSSG